LDVVVNDVKDDIFGTLIHFLNVVDPVQCFLVKEGVEEVKLELLVRV